MTWRRTLMASLGLALLAGACGDDADEGAVDPTRGVSVETTLEPSEIQAGGSATVTCVGRNQAGELLEGETFTLDLTPAEGGTASGLTVSSTVAGVLQVACHAAGSGAVDDTPASLTVLAGPPVRTTLTLDPTTVKAGQEATVDCVAVDSYGNRTDDPTYIASDPAGITFTDTTAVASAEGTYTLTCISQTITDSAAQGTATLTVEAGDPGGIELYFKPEALAYPTDKAILVVGRGVDGQGNVVREEVPVTNLTVSPAGHHSVVGTNQDKLRFDQEGKYTVTATAVENSAWTASAQLVVDATPPLLTLTSPSRGLVYKDENNVSFIGTVSDNLGEVSLRIGDHEVALPPEGGAFNEVLPVDYALNLFDIVASDPWGNEALATRAVEKSTEYFTLDSHAIDVDGVDNAVVVMLTQEAIDDGDRDEEATDDLATLFKLIIDNIDYASFITNPLGSFPCIGGDCTLDFDGVSYSSSEIALTLLDGKLHMKVVLNDFSATITLNAPCSFALCPSDPLPIPGSATASRVVLEMDIVLSISGGETVAEAQNTEVVIDDFAVELNDPTGLLQGLVDGAMSYIEPTLVSGMETLFAGLIEDQLASAFGGIFDAFAIDQTFEIPSPVEGLPGNSIVIKTAPAGVDISPERMQVRLDAISYAENPARPFPSLGSIGHRGCAPYSSLIYPPPAPMVVGLHDSLINQILFAVWEGGTLTMDLGPGEADGLVDGFGITDLALKVEAHLPPVFDSCGRDGNYLQLGDLFLDADMKFGGAPMHFALWLQTEVAVDVEIAENEEGVLQTKLVLGDLDPLMVELVENDGMFADDDEAVISLLKDTIVPQLLGTIGDMAPFELPQIDLGAMADGIPEGTIIELDVSGIGRDNAYLTINGGLK